MKHRFILTTFIGIVIFVSVISFLLYLMPIKEMSSKFSDCQSQYSAFLMLKGKVSDSCSFPGFFAIGVDCMPKSILYSSQDPEYEAYKDRLKEESLKRNRETPQNIRLRKKIFGTICVSW